MTLRDARRIPERVAEAGADKSTRALIITGAPGVFRAGTDLADLATVPGATRLRGARTSAAAGGRSWSVQTGGRAIDGPRSAWARIQLAMRHRIASPKARFAWNFVHRGLVPDTGAGSWLLPRLMARSAR
jgi:enoyl-CoA hydratase/carnithine racemase